MTNYNVTIFDYISDTPRYNLCTKVKHFRQYDGRTVKTHGGHSAVFDMTSGLVFSSKCRDDEQFSRRKGVLTCIQKLLLSKSFSNEDKSKMFIADVRFLPNGCNVWISDEDCIAEGPYWWLNGERLNSLYA